MGVAGSSCSCGGSGQVRCSAVAQDEQQLMWAALLTGAIPGLWGAGRTGCALGVLAEVCLCVGLDHWSSRTVRLHSRLPVCPQYLWMTCFSHRDVETQGWGQGLASSSVSG